MSKGRLRIDPGEFPVDQILFNGTISIGEKRFTFTSQDSKSSIEKIDGTTSSLSASVNATTNEGDSIEIKILVSASGSENNTVFEIDSFETFHPRKQQKMLEIYASKKLAMLGDGKGARYDSCALEQYEDEGFSFEFSDGERLALITRSRHSTQETPAQFGLLMSAKGSIPGIVVQSVDWNNLSYTAREWTPFLKAPGLALRLPRKNKQCGVAFVPDGEQRRYRAFQLDCSFQLGEELKLKSQSIPPHFRWEGIQ